MTGSYVFWAILGMVAYSITTVVVKIAAREGLPSSVVVAIATTVVALACWSIVVARAQSGMLLQSLSTPSGAWSLAAGAALSVAVTSLFRALELGPASVVVPIYGMFIVGGFVLGVILLGETITLPKAIGLIAAIASIYLISA
jgi:bacterial/archaeal transporter family protein